MAPRTLEPVPVSQLTIWGLHGLTALDPDLATGTARRQAACSTGRGRARRRGRRPPATTSKAGHVLASELLPLRGWQLLCRYARRHTGRGAKLLRRVVQPPRSLLPLRAPRDASQDRERRIGEAGAGLRVAPARIGHRGGGGHRRWAWRARRHSAGDTILSVDGKSTHGKDARLCDGLDRRPGRNTAHDCLARPGTDARTRSSWNAPWFRRRPSSRSASATRC